MSTTNQIYESSSTNMLKYGAITIFVASIVSFVIELVLSLTNYTNPYTINYFTLIGNVILAAGIFLIGFSTYKIGMSFPMAQIQASSVRTWLLIDAITLLLNYIPFVVYVTSLIGLVAGIVGFLKLNKLFKIISDTSSQQERLNSWVIPVYAFIGLIKAGLAVVFGFIIGIYAFANDASSDIFDAAVFIASIIILGVGIFIAGGVAYVLFKNARKLEYIRQFTDFSQLPQTPLAGAIYQPITPTQPVHPLVPTKGTKFCSNCGSKLLDTDKFCPTCGTDISLQ